MNAEEKAQELADAIHAVGELFISKIPETVKAMEDELKLIVQDMQNLVPWKSLDRQLHSLAGSAGMFGYPEFGDRARALEIRIKSLLKSEFSSDADSIDAFVQNTFIRDQQEFIAWIRENVVKK